MSDTYRIVRSSEAGYGPGKFVVQKWYSDSKVWGDVGDLVGSSQEAQRKLDSAVREAKELRIRERAAYALDFDGGSYG